MKIGNLEVDWLGDPHLARKFETGVPVHRKGEQERLQVEQFVKALHETKADVHVTVGDLFDKFIVPPEAVLLAANAYKQASEENPNTLYVVLRGNHDVSRNTDKASSWDLFCALVRDEGNVWAVDDYPAFYEGMLFVPYDPFNYDHLEEELATHKPHTVFSHFDIVDFGGHNVIPLELFAEHGVTQVINGHDHNQREFEFENVKVIVTGSMRPFTHGEDAEGQLYITVSLEDLAGLDVRDKNVRVLLQPGETLPADLDCLSLTAKRVGSVERREVDTSEFESLEIKTMLSAALDGLSIKNAVMEQFLVNQ